MTEFIPMDFLTFAYNHGLLIADLDTSGELQRCPTEDHPNSMNGAYSYDGEWGWVQNWSSESYVSFFNEGNRKDFTKEEYEALKLVKQRNEEIKLTKYKEAASRAEEFIKTLKLRNHYYLNAKGFPDEMGLVDSDSNLIIPMFSYADYSLVGYQKIFWDDHKYHKKMCAGMKAKGAIHILGNRNAHEYILCEGYATGLSLKKAIELGNLNMAVVICFSNGNMSYIGNQLKSRPGYVYADNDVPVRLPNGSFVNPGIKSAELSGLPWICSPKEGHDANDDMMAWGSPFVLNQILDITKSTIFDTKGE